MKDITDRFEELKLSYVNPEEGSIGSKVSIGNDPQYILLIVPYEKGLFADVSKYSKSSKWPIGLISYVDDDDILIKGDAVCSQSGTNQVVYGQYNRFELIFPEGATKVYVNSIKAMPPKIYKKVM